MGGQKRLRGARRRNALLVSGKWYLLGLQVKPASLPRAASGGVSGRGWVYPYQVVQVEHGIDSHFLEYRVDCVVECILPVPPMERSLDHCSQDRLIGNVSECANRVIRLVRNGSNEEPRVCSGKPSQAKTSKLTPFPKTVPIWVTLG